MGRQHLQPQAYFFNRDNLERYSDGASARAVPERTGAHLMPATTNWKSSYLMDRVHCAKRKIETIETELPKENIESTIRGHNN